MVGSRNRSILELGNGELKVISMIYAPPYLIRRSVPKVKSIDHELAASPTVTPRARKTANTGSKQRSTTITTEHHTIKKETHSTTTRYRSIVENGY